MTGGIIGLILLVSTGTVMGLTPAEERWEAFIAAHPGTVRLPEDPRMGPLVNPDSTEPAWSDALAVCESVFEALGEGRIPSEAFRPGRSLPLATAFGALLEPGARMQTHLYGRPIREEHRITVPVRVDGGETPAYGYVYLERVEDRWYIDQWSVDLTGLPAIESPENEAPGETSPEPDVS